MQKRIKSRGFTLLEMMVAIAILALVSSAVYFSNSQALTTQVRIEEQTIAQWILSNQVSLAKLSEKLQDSRGSPYFQSNMIPRSFAFAGMEWEVVPRLLPSRFERIKRVRWEIFRNIEGRQVGPIKTYEAVIRQEK